MKSISIHLMVLVTLLLSLFHEKEASAQTVTWAILDTTVVSQDTILLPVRMLTDPTGMGIVSFQSTIRSAAQRYELIDVVTTGTLAEELGAISTNRWLDNLNRPTITISAAGAAPLTSSGVLFYVRYRATTTGSNRIRFTGVNRINEGDVDINFGEGLISLTAAPSITLTPSSSTMIPGETLQFSSSGGQGGYTYGVSDPSVASISSNGLLTAIQPGTVQVTSADSTGLSRTSGDIVIRPLEIEAGHVSALAGDEVLVPILLDNPDAIPILSMGIRLSYLNSRLSFVEVVTAGSQSSSALVDAAAQTVNSSEQLTLSLASAQPLSGVGPVMYVKFLVRPVGFNPTVTLNVDQGICNETLQARYDHGQVAVMGQNVTIQPSAQQTLLVDQRINFSASGGQTPYSWTVSDPLVGLVNDDGLFIARTVGVAEVIVTDATGANVASASVQVLDADLRIETTCVRPLSTVWVPIRLGDLPNGQTASAFEFHVGFRSPELNYVGYETQGTLSADWLLIDEEVANDEVRLVAAGSAPTSGGGVLVFLGFETTASLTNGEFAAIDFISQVLNEGTPEVLALDGGVRRTDAEILSITPGSASNCADFGSVYDQDLVVTYADAPSGAQLVVQGQSFALTGSPQTITLTDIPGDGMPVDVTAGFSNVNCRDIFDAAFTAADCNRGRIYVDGRSLGDQDGSSWHHAYRTLHEALDASVAQPEVDIYVAEGVYTPSASGARASTLTLHEGTHVYGRFLGYEGHVSERDLSLDRPTVLSGDIGGTGVPANFVHHVVKTEMGAGTGYSLLDQVYIQDGNASGGCSPCSGAGVLNEGRLFMRHVEMTETRSAPGGAAVLNRFTAPAPPVDLIMEHVSITAGTSATAPFEAELGTSVDMRTNVTLETP